jgi:hypothetical protein
VRLEVLTGMLLNIQVSWDVKLCHGVKQFPDLPRIIVPPCSEFSSLLGHEEGGMVILKNTDNWLHNSNTSHPKIIGTELLDGCET